MMIDYVYLVRVVADEEAKLSIDLAAVLRSNTTRQGELFLAGYEPVSLGTFRTLWRERDTLHCTVSPATVLPEILEMEVGK